VGACATADKYGPQHVANALLLPQGQGVGETAFFIVIENTSFKL
jgi:hypothetical protein